MSPTRHETLISTPRLHMRKTQIRSHPLLTTPSQYPTIALSSAKRFAAFAEHLHRVYCSKFSRRSVMRLVLFSLHYRPASLKIGRQNLLDETFRLLSYSTMFSVSIYFLGMQESTHCLRNAETLQTTTLDKRQSKVSRLIRTAVLLLSFYPIQLLAGAATGERRGGRVEDCYVLLNQFPRSVPYDS